MVGCFGLYLPFDDFHGFFWEIWISLGYPYWFFCFPRDRCIHLPSGSKSSSIPRNFCQPNSAACGWYCWWFRNPATSNQLIWRIYHYLQGFKNIQKGGSLAGFLNHQQYRVEFGGLYHTLGEATLIPNLSNYSYGGDGGGYEGILDPGYGDLPGKKWTHFIVLPKDQEVDEGKVVWGLNASMGGLESQ